MPDLRAAEVGDLMGSMREYDNVLITRIRRPDDFGGACLQQNGGNAEPPRDPILPFRVIKNMIPPAIDKDFIVRSEAAAVLHDPVDEFVIPVGESGSVRIAGIRSYIGGHNPDARLVQSLHHFPVMLPLPGRMRVGAAVHEIDQRPWVFFVLPFIQQILPVSRQNFYISGGYAMLRKTEGIALNKQRVTLCAMLLSEGEAVMAVQQIKTVGIDLLFPGGVSPESGLKLQTPR